MDVAFILRFLLKSNFVEVILTSAKLRVDALCKTIIPLLELLANILSSRLMSSVRNNLNSVYSIHKIFAWTDSSIAYAWIQSII